MMGIVSTGCYIPYYRLSRDRIAAAWGRSSLKGERSVANNDEDSITMAVEAAFNCIEDRGVIDGLFYGTTSSPYLEKSGAGLIATACDLKDEIMTADYGSSLRAGLAALTAAINTVKAKSAKNILVTASDCRLGYPRSDQEQLFGDGAAALLIGEDDVIAKFEAHYSVNNEIVDIWRTNGDTFVRAGEERFILTEGYQAAMTTAISAVMEKAGIKPADVGKLVLSTPNLKVNLSVAKRLGFDPKSQVQDSLMSSVGNCGVAQPLMLLIAALETAAPGDKLLLAGYGNGADAYVFTVTDNISRFKEQNGIKRYLEQKAQLPSYERYLSYRGILEAVPGEPFRLFPSNSAYWRDRKSILRFHGSKCRQCGVSCFPIQRVCHACGAVDDYDHIPCYDKKGKVFTYSVDKLAGRSDDPVVVQTVVETDDGSRFYMLMTDCDPAEVEIGLAVEFTFRQIYKGANYYNYYWKCRPVRDGRVEQ